MDYIPRYRQPFTLAEAVKLDVSTITEEISRLQNSLKHLNETQDIIEASLKEEEDSDLRKAMDENREVIGSQQERISILRMALTEKGIIGGAHYDLQTSPDSATQPRTSSAVQPSQTTDDEAESGVYL
ncbi:hypothetical protein D9613_005301 [Agrocybe pediades]|uniref:Uncharacterized protein n=1 Tax=Agrocybe pediades TaxID=84607 RepID=A0A8H4QYE5_9AGAR|nr:hypothetical protein D9613_005301 [Agrocybe pediades]